jgi:hypothetical protein
VLRLDVRRSFVLAATSSSGKEWDPLIVVALISPFVVHSLIQLTKTSCHSSQRTGSTCFRRAASGSAKNAP